MISENRLNALNGSCSLLRVIRTIPDILYSGIRIAEKKREGGGVGMLLEGDRE
jgi:hypothetical protein